MPGKGAEGSARPAGWARSARPGGAGRALPGVPPGGTATPLQTIGQNLDGGCGNHLMRSAVGAEGHESE